MRGLAGKVKTVCRRIDKLDDERLAELFHDDEDLKRVKALTPGATALLGHAPGPVQFVSCLAKSSPELAPYEQVKERARNRCLQQRYEELVSELVKKAEVRTNLEMINSLLP